MLVAAASAVHEGAAEAEDDQDGAAKQHQQPRAQGSRAGLAGVGVGAGLLRRVEGARGLRSGEVRGGRGRARRWAVLRPRDFVVVLEEADLPAGAGAEGRGCWGWSGAACSHFRFWGWAVTRVKCGLVPRGFPAPAWRGPRNGAARRGGLYESAAIPHPNTVLSSVFFNI